MAGCFRDCVNSKVKESRKARISYSKLKTLEGDAPECWLAEQTDGTDDVEFLDASTPASPVTAGRQMLANMVSSDVENRADTASV